MLEFGIAAAVIFPIFAGSFQYGYSYYVYNNLQTSIRAAGRYAAARTYDSATATPSAAFTTAVKNMAVYGNPLGGTRSLAPNLTTDKVAVSVAFSMGTPSRVTVQVNNFQINGVFGTVILNGKPRATFPYLGRWDPI
jgi:Flp pilus assembly protein TadG